MLRSSLASRLWLQPHLVCPVLATVSVAVPVAVGAVRAHEVAPVEQVLDFVIPVVPALSVKVCPLCTPETVIGATEAPTAIFCGVGDTERFEQFNATVPCTDGSGLFAWGTSCFI